MNLSFNKLSACGNDFVALDNRDRRLSGGETELIRYLCDRRRGAGADGLLLVEEDPAADFRMRIFNPDGSEARMCGNGARACAFFAAGLGIGGEELRFSTRAGLQRARLESGRQSRLWLSPPEARGLGEPELAADPRLVDELRGAHIAGFLRVGVPHLVVEVETELASYPIETVGPWLRYHAAYAPEGTNVMFVQRLTNQHLHLRAWEKGVEDETWGCGTGAVACCLTLEESAPLQFPVTVRMLGGDLIVSRQDGEISFSGEIHESYRAVASLPAELA
ncbi:MAG: diaminopimelate epimerase [Candidatus Delongbacteria bacterium]